jgi:membrane protease YdiL (CAAX protease family)
MLSLRVPDSGTCVQSRVDCSVAVAKSNSQTLQSTPSAPPPTPPSSPAGAGPPAAGWREPGKALAIVFGGTLLLAIVQWALPFTAGFMQVGLALILLEVPIRLVPPAERAALYLRIGPARRGLRLGLATILIVFPPFVAGFHLVYTEVLERPADWDVAHLLRWSEDLEYAPSAACDRAETSVWTQEGQLWVVPPSRSRLELRLETREPPRNARIVRCTPPRRGPSTAAVPTTGTLLQRDADGLYRPPAGSGVFFQLGDATAFTLHLADQRGPVPATDIRLGSRSVAGDDDGLVEGTRSYLWLLAYILIHLGLVAYPEEYFFRGYLLPRLDQRLGTPRRVLGVALGRGLVLSALAFALLHPILIPGPHRLLVFFPALLFGWLAARQRELGAAILVHAASNVLLAVVSRMYGA